MTSKAFDSDRPPRFASRGRTFVYVFQCVGEDILKVGFSSAPLSRLRALHSRYFEFFDLDRSFLMEADYLRDARRIERLFINTLVDHQAPSPLVVKREAAGHTEWHRSAYSQALAMGKDICTKEALVMHSPLRAWLLSRFNERMDLLYQWSSSLLNAIEFAQQNGAPEVANHYGNVLRDVIDEHMILGAELKDRVPKNVMTWYRIYKCKLA